MYKIIGIKRVNGINKKTGVPYTGTNLYTTYEMQDTEGVRCADFYLPGTCDCSCLALGDEIDILFNQFRKPVSFTI